MANQNGPVEFWSEGSPHHCRGRPSLYGSKIQTHSAECVYRCCVGSPAGETLCDDLNNLDVVVKSCVPDERSAELLSIIVRLLGTKFPLLVPLYVLLVQLIVFHSKQLTEQREESIPTDDSP
jgi:hypothetical protein